MKWCRTFRLGSRGRSLPSRERGLKFLAKKKQIVDPKLLPSRERGLKLTTVIQGGSMHLSLPSRERGLKSIGRKAKMRKGMSLPSWERGLKYGLEQVCESPLGSLPSRERGLKSILSMPVSSSLQVAPFTGAWIEMSRKWCDCHAPGSISSWELGLKIGT